MLSLYNLNDKEIIIKSDLAAEFPIYIYISEDKTYLLYSTSIKELLDHAKVIKPLEIRSEGISFLLQSGVVPLPKTVYKNIFIVGIGDTARVTTINNQINIEFSHEFPFLNRYRDDEADVCESYILEIIAEATFSKIDDTKPSYLFHSAGKDSNTIALALAEAGYQDKITCISHKSKGEKDESVISKEIAIKLGFKHEILYEPKSIEQKQIESINYYFENIPLPCMDNIALAYPLYATQIEFQNTNIVDGSGNDVYMGHIPSKLEFIRQKRYSKFHNLRPLTGKLASGKKIEYATATRSEWAGLFGITYGDTKKIFNTSFDVHKYWEKEDLKRSNWDYFDLRADIWGTIVEFDRVIRKSRNLADTNNANLILPFTNQKVAAYFAMLPEKFLFDRNKYKNKLILRKMLKERIGLDSDILGKMAYEFDFFGILMMMKQNVDYEILACSLWDSNGIKKVLNELYGKISSNHRSSLRIKALVQRLYLISAWYSKNRYVKR